MVFDKELDENLKVCGKCEHHFPIGARERIHSLVETCSFEEMDADMTSVDVLQFTGVASYKSKLDAYQKSTGQKDAVLTGIGKIGPFRVGLGVMDFSFLGGSMGSVVGEKLTRLIEAATDKALRSSSFPRAAAPACMRACSASCKWPRPVPRWRITPAPACRISASSRIPPRPVSWPATPAWATSSSPNRAMIGFAGPRVIKDTTQGELPPGFQTAEFLVEHGLIDAIVSRKEMKERLLAYLDFSQRHPQGRRLSAVHCSVRGRGKGLNGRPEQSGLGRIRASVLDFARASAPLPIEPGGAGIPAGGAIRSTRRQGCRHSQVHGINSRLDFGAVPHPRASPCELNTEH
jgi:acetyl-CoA carboxylase carboxyl transferase subunit beta